jgi:hypothetical protein
MLRGWRRTLDQQPYRGDIIWIEGQQRSRRRPRAPLTTCSRRELSAEWLGVSIQFLEIGRHRGYGPKFVRIGPARIRYRRAEILAWLEARTFASTSQYGEVA